MKVSLCIPQYNRIEYLLNNLASLEKQSYENLEVIITDDCSTDNTESEINNVIEKYRFPITYYRHPENVGYDANLRKSMELASGDYCFLLGNDDTIPGKDSVKELMLFLKQNNYPDIGFTNYVEDKNPPVTIERANATIVLGANAEIALKYYSSFSFVGGLVIKRAQFENVNTDRMDGTVYVQMYFAARIISAGGVLFTYKPAIVLKDLRINGSMSNSYRDRLMKKWSDFAPIDGGLRQVIYAVTEGFKDGGIRDANMLYKIIRNIYCRTYPFWLFDYRSNGAFVGAYGLTKGLNPALIPQIKELPLGKRIKLKGLYGVFTVVGLFFPVIIFKKVQYKIYKWIKS